MYLPPHFAVTDPEALHQLMQAHPWGALITCGEGAGCQPPAVRVRWGAGAHGCCGPMWPATTPLAGGERRRRGAGDLPRRRGLYLPSWYPGKQVHHQQVPTWNYAVVHAHGRIRVRDDARFVRRLLATLTRTHEAGESIPWKMADAPRDYLETMVQAVVGIEIEIERLVGKFKLGQNKEAADRLGAANALQERGQTALAGAMLNPPPSQS